MMKTYIKRTIALIMIVALSACSEDYFDVNRPSNTASLDQLRMNDLIAPVIHSTMEGQYSAEQAFGNYTQYFVGQGGTAVGLTEASGLWSQVYLYILPNIMSIKEKATAEGAIHINAVADILTAINIGIATDTWDNIPYSEASQSPENNFPGFDTQETIYNEVFALLDNAIAALQQTDDSGFTLGSEDLIYDGDMDKWLRAAYTVKARYQLHLVNKGVITPAEVISTIVNGFTSNDDDFQMFYDEKNINPWYSQEILARNTGNFHNDICKQFVSSMNGDYFPFASSLEIDPRLSVFATNEGAAEWKGFVSGGEGLAPDGTPANTLFIENGYYTSIDSPLVLITYGEAMFIKAEAEFLANGGTPASTGSTASAYESYLAGIQASMDKFGVDGSAYLADASISVGAGNLMLQHIMKEKYIHNFLNPETFVDFRRYDFSDDVFKGLEIREEGDDPDPEFSGQWFRRADYPSSEANRNSANVEANRQSVLTPVWWDQ